MSLVRRNRFTVIRQVNVDDAALKKIAEALGIPEAEHERITSISGEVQIGTEPAPVSSGTTSQGGDGSPGASGGDPAPAPGGTAGSGR
jgi:hypothetical protein